MPKLTPEQKEELRKTAAAMEAHDKAIRRGRIAAEAARDERAYRLIQEAQAKGQTLTLADARAKAEEEKQQETGGQEAAQPKQEAASPAPKAAKAPKTAKA